MDLAIIKEYGLAVFILIGAGKGLQMLYTNMRADMKESQKSCKDMLKKIQDDNKDREKEIQNASKQREDRIIEAMNKQVGALKTINVTVESNSTELKTVKRILEELIRKESA